MTRFASRELSFVSFADVIGPGGTTGHTQQCGDRDGAGACTCCTNNTAAKPKLAVDSDLSGLRDQLRTACS